MEPTIVLFDGVCNLCNGAVRWIIARDRACVFRFAALKSPGAARVLASAGFKGELPDSMVVVSGGRVLVRSDAAIAVARGLGFPWSCARVCAVLPRRVRDGMYGWIAANRYRWFGKRDVCMMPSEELRGRFVEEDVAGGESSKAQSSKAAHAELR